MIECLVKLKRSEFGRDFQWQWMFRNSRDGKMFVLKYMDCNKAVYMEEENNNNILIIENDENDKEKNK